MKAQFPTFEEWYNNTKPHSEDEVYYRCWGKTYIHPNGFVITVIGETSIGIDNITSTTTIIKPQEIVVGAVFDQTPENLHLLKKHNGVIGDGGEQDWFQTKKHFYPTFSTFKDAYDFTCQVDESMVTQVPED